MLCKRFGAIGLVKNLLKRFEGSARAFCKQLPLLGLFLLRAKIRYPLVTMVAINTRARTLLKERLLRAKKKKHGIYLILSGILFVVTCVLYDPQSLSTKGFPQEDAGKTLSRKQPQTQTFTSLDAKNVAKRQMGAERRSPSTEAFPAEDMRRSVVPKMFQSLPSKASHTKDTDSKKMNDNLQSLASNDINKEGAEIRETENLPEALPFDYLNEGRSTSEQASGGLHSTQPDVLQMYDTKSMLAASNTEESASPPSKKGNEENRNLEESMPPSTIEDTGISGGKAFRVQANWNRLHSPWFRPQLIKLLTPEESNYRYLYSSTRVGTSDGIGHSMGVINRDFNFAISLNLTYTHRVGMYSSLTSKDRFAVENFFGWGNGEIPRTHLQKEGCVAKNNAWPGPSQINECHICEAPLPSGALKIKHLVDIPTDLRSNCISPDDPCQPMKLKFLSAHGQSHTIFQASRRTCNPPATDGNFLVTKSLFFHKYWDRHGQLPWNPEHSQLSNNPRPIRYKQEELNVALHVRRGDFLDPETQAKRGITQDETFAKVLIDVLSVVDTVGGKFSTLPIVVHIYSEGKLTQNRVPSVHTIEMQDNQYYDSNGTTRDATWWTELILQTTTSKELPPLLSLRERIKVVMHISEDTLLSLHEMVSADIFVGSKSGLSNALVWSLSRGVVLIPHASTINVERGKKGEICCSIPFENNNGFFDHSLFNLYWTAYVRANEASLVHPSRFLNGA